MGDPTRMRNHPGGLTAGAEVLLRGARRPQPPDAGDLERLGAAVEGISRSPRSAPPSALRLAVAGLVAATIAGGGTFVWAWHVRENRRLAAAEATRNTAEALHRLRPTQPLVVAEHPPAPSAPAPRPGRRHAAETRVAAAAPIEAPAPAPTKNDALSREVPLIDAGRADLAAGAPSRALESLEAHRREFPRGQLAAEREFLAVQALVQMNRGGEAKERAEDLAYRFPSSSYAARATRLIEDVQAQKTAVPAHDGSRAGARPGQRRDQDRL
jgi:hypothetical protein